MPEKLFKLRDAIDETIQCEEISGNGEWMTHGEIVDLLNEQHETIFQLRKELCDYNCTIRQLQDKIDVRNELLEQFEDENEQLKSKNKELKKKLEEYKKLVGKVFWCDVE